MNHKTESIKKRKEKVERKFWTNDEKRRIEINERCLSKRRYKTKFQEPLNFEKIISKYKQTKELCRKVTSRNQIKEKRNEKRILKVKKEKSLIIFWTKEKRMSLI